MLKVISTNPFSDLLQGSDEWKLARLGKVTASRISCVVAKTKTGWGASRATYMAEKIAERLTGIPTEGYVSDAMQWGNFTEPEGRKAYSDQTGIEVNRVGFVPHPTIEMAGCSPDGLIGDDGQMEIKCPNTATHIGTFIGGAPYVPDKYEKQIQFQLACTGRQWCDFVSYDPRVPEHLRLFIKRVHRNLHQIVYLEKYAREFLAEIDQTLTALGAKENTK